MEARPIAPQVQHTLPPGSLHGGCVHSQRAACSTECTGYLHFFRMLVGATCGYLGARLHVHLSDFKILEIQFDSAEMDLRFGEVAGRRRKPVPEILCTHGLYCRRMYGNPRVDLFRLQATASGAVSRQMHAAGRPPPLAPRDMLGSSPCFSLQGTWANIFWGLIAV